MLRECPLLNSVSTQALRSLRVQGATFEWLVRHFHRIGLVTTALPNGSVLQLWSRGDDWISNQVFWRGWVGHEPETTTVFFRLAERSACTIDVGAYVGYYALLAAHASPTARVIALEPLPAVHARLTRHVSLNGISNVECVMAAAGAREGAARFYHVPQGLPTSSSLSRDFMATADNVVASEVPVVTIDGLVRDRGIARVDLVKLDTESTEPDVLEGMRETLARDRPALVCEVLKGRGAEERLAPILEPFGYRFYLLTPNGPERRTRIDGHPTWLNYLFVARPEHFPIRWPV